MRLIDADKLKEDLQKHHDFFIDAWKENGVDKIEIPIPDKSRMDEIINCISMVVNAPTVEVGYLTNCANCERVEKIRAKRPHGEWKLYNAYFKTCSLCNKTVGFDYIEQDEEKFNYCPNCGAKMDGGES